MLAAYFGFKGEPFEDSSGSTFIASNLYLRGVAAQLLAGIAERKGLTLVLGEAASGRKLLLSHLAGELRGHCRFVAVDCARDGSFDDILARCCAELGIAEKGGERLQRARALVNHFIAQMPEGRTTVLLVDEAQNLDADALRNLFLLSELGERRPVQIVLAGRAELEAQFAAPDLASVLRGVALSCRLPSLRVGDLQAYIQAQLERVEAPDRDLFSPEAIERAAILLHGCPELVDRLCIQALVITRLEGLRAVTAEAVEQAAQAVLAPIERPPPEKPAPAPAVRVLPAPAPQVHEPRPVFVAAAEPTPRRPVDPAPRGPVEAAPRRAAVELMAPARDEVTQRRLGRVGVAAFAGTALMVLGGSAWILKDRLTQIGAHATPAATPASVVATKDLSKAAESFVAVAPAAGSSTAPELPLAGPPEPVASIGRTESARIPAALSPAPAAEAPVVLLPAVATEPAPLAPKSEAVADLTAAVELPRSTVAALPSQAEPTVRTPQPPPPLGAAEEQMMSRGNALVATGDFAGARLYFERAASAGNPRALTAVGKTYDPNFHAEAGFPQSPANPDRAAEWYVRAAESDPEAATRLRRLQRK